MSAGGGSKIRSNKNTKKEKGIYGIAIAAGACLVISAALSAAARTVSGFAEWYSVTVYPLLQGSVGRLSGAAPFSVAEVLALALPLLLLADLAVNRRRLRRTAAHVVLAASLLLLLYMANCGVNYYRAPLVSREALSEADLSEAQLKSFCEYTAEQLRLSSAHFYGGTDAYKDAYPDAKGLADAAVSAMEKLGRTYDELRGYYPRPKELRALAPLFSMMGVSGIYSPFTIEANINGEMEGMEKPFTACHELSHLRGYMDEGEANYIGWLACIGADEPSFVRSGWLIAWSYAGSSLRRVDPESFEKIYSSLPEDAREELAANHEFWESRENKASEVQDRVNDAYLKSNGLDEGIASYGRLTTMMLMWYTQKCNA